MPPPEIRPRVFVEAVPDRRFASCIRTASCSNEALPSVPKTRPDTSTSPRGSHPAENSGTLTGATCALGIRLLRRNQPPLRLGGVFHRNDAAVRAGHGTRDK